MLAKHVSVLVRRDMAEIIGTTCFEHEVEILRDIHGESAIEEVESNFEPVEIDAGEAERMGAFEESALSYADALEANLMGEVV